MKKSAILLCNRMLVENPILEQNKQHNGSVLGHCLEITCIFMNRASCCKFIWCLHTKYGAPISPCSHENPCGSLASMKLNRPPEVRYLDPKKHQKTHLKHQTSADIQISTVTVLQYVPQLFFFHPKGAPVVFTKQNSQVSS